QAFDFDTMVGEMMFGLLVVFGRLQQCLGRNAAHIGASTTRSRLAFGIGPGVDTCSRKAQLCCTDSRYVTAGAGADNYYVKLFSHDCVLVKLRLPVDTRL